MRAMQQKLQARMEVGFGSINVLHFLSDCVSYIVLFLIFVITVGAILLQFYLSIWLHRYFIMHLR